MKSNGPVPVKLTSSVTGSPIQIVDVPDRVAVGMGNMFVCFDTFLCILPYSVYTKCFLHVIYSIKSKTVELLVSLIKMLSN